MEKAKNEIETRGMSVTKTLNAPIQQVWEAWTDTGHIVNWWGPSGFTNTIRKMEVKEGGEWLFTMHGPDGKNYPNKIVFSEIVPLKKIVFRHFNPNYMATIVFEPKENETLIEWTMVFETTELFEIVVKTFKADEGLKQNVEKLDKYLREMRSY